MNTVRILTENIKKNQSEKNTITEMKNRRN